MIAICRCKKAGVQSPCVLVIRCYDRVSSSSALSPEGSTETLVESIRRARLSRLVSIASVVS